MTTKFEDSFSKEIWENTYKHHTDETIDDTFRRVAKAVSSVENTKILQKEWEEKFFDMLSDFKVVTGGRILANAGTEFGNSGTSMINCFTAPRRNYDIDSLENIIKTLHDQAQTLKSEGGWGENFSWMRPRGGFIYGIGVETPGTVKYMELFDKASDIITSGSGKKSTNKTAKGKIRKGAMMSILDITHPDIIEFINAKQTPGKLTKFNMSVNCTDEFMNKVIKVLEMKKSKNYSKDEIETENKWELRFPDTKYSKYKKEWFGDLTDWEDKGYPVKIYNTVLATELWNMIMKSTYNRAEPGILFLDRGNYYNPLNYYEKIYASNPCSEQLLAPGGCCNLGSINLTQFVNGSNTNINFKKLKRYISYLVRFLDNVNSYSNVPLKEYKQNMEKKRRIGIGIMGYGSLLYMLKIKYASNEAAVLRKNIMKTISKTSYETSIELAKEKGMFEYCDAEKHANGVFVKSLNLSNEYMESLKKTGIRNSSLLSIQPCGNTSILANVVSGGCEPIFMSEYIRTVIVTIIPEHIVDVCPKWYEGEWQETTMFKFRKEGDETILKGIDTDGTVYKIDKNRGLTKEMLCEDYGVRYLKSINEWNPKADWAITTIDLTPDDHIRELKGFARYVDSSISKTINLPNNYKFEDFKNIYLNAYNSEYIKGVTTYRTGTMSSVLSAKEEKNADIADEEIIKEDVKLPESAKAMIKTIRAENRKWYLTIVYHEDNQNRPFALFVKTNAVEKGVVADEAVELLFKLARKKKIPKRHIDKVHDKLKFDTNSSKVTRLVSFLLRHGVLIKNIVAILDKVESAYVGTFVFQIKKFLSVYIKDGEKVEDEICQECGSTTIVFSEGCKQCKNCSSSKCG